MVCAKSGGDESGSAGRAPQIPLPMADGAKSAATHGPSHGQTTANPLWEESLSAGGHAAAAPAASGGGDADPGLQMPVAHGATRQNPLFGEVRDLSQNLPFQLHVQCCSQRLTLR